ncbi:protein-lysine N-trimethyltransferase SMYD5-like [Diadema setosum]|uniref:protein-lysine N-trimethyltransferase SMYD5-like n=1 Tax=Diadema setosum TaxID=31175 RepID=UPI003B3BE95F
MMMNIDNANCSIQIIDEHKGRGLVAACALKVDDVIFEESPLVCAQFLWNEFYHYEACEFCMRSLESAVEMARRLSGDAALVLPHQECCTVEKQSHVECPQCRAPYCSTECRDHALAQYHQVLCPGQHPPDPDHPLFILQEAWKTMHYPPETASIMLIAKMIATIKQAKCEEEVIATFQQFCHAPRNEERELSHKLLGEQFKGQFETLQSILLDALYEETVSQWFTKDGLESLFALIGMNGQGVGSSSLSVYVHNCDALDLPEEERGKLDQFIDQLYVAMEKESGSFLNCEGSALYRLQSCCNHSCTPNAEIRFLHNNSTLSLVAVADIAEGEEILISYLDECSRERSRHSRQKELRENYLFTCNCSKCLQQCDDPDITSSEEEDDDDDDDEDDNGGGDDGGQEKDGEEERIGDKVGMDTMDWKEGRT